MKKTLLSLCLALASLAGMAQTNYNETLVVTINGESTPEVPASITVTENGDGTCDFSLVNFKLAMGEQSIPVGTIHLKGVQMEAHETYQAISTTQTILIDNGDDPEEPFWMGPDLGEVPIVLSGRFTVDHLYANIDIDMTATLGQVINVVVGDVNTSIHNVSAPAARSQAVYTLGGIRVANAWNASLPKGVYVVGGKKVIK